MLKQKWINDKKAKLKGEIQALQNQAQQLQQQLVQISQAILRKQGELQAIKEVEVELIQKEKELPKKKEKREKRQ